MSALFPTSRSPLRMGTAGLFDDLDCVRARLLDTFDPPVTEGGWTMAMSDLEERDDAYVVNVEVPGCDRDDIRIEMEGRRLSVHAEREEGPREGTLRSSTRSGRHLHHEVTLPADVDAENIEASLERGVLTIRIPKSETAGRRRIEIG
jgi:HSP20 family protein